MILLCSKLLYFSFVFTDGCGIVEPNLSTVFCPDHKAAMVLFLDRVYGIENQSFLLHLIEVGFLPDLQAAVSLDTVRKNIPFNYSSHMLKGHIFILSNILCLVVKI